MFSEVAREPTENDDIVAKKRTGFQEKHSLQMVYNQEVSGHQEGFGTSPLWGI